MHPTETLLHMYEDLANRYARQGDARLRDHCLVLAADAALHAGQPDQAERLRKRLLLTNPHHLLRPYGSLEEALQSEDVRDYIADLRGKWPREVVEKMLREVPSKGETYDLGIAEPAPPAREAPEPVEIPKPAKPPKPKSAPAPAAAPPLILADEDAPSSPAEVGVAIVLMVLVTAAVGAGLFFALGGPILE